MSLLKNKIGLGNEQLNREKLLREEIIHKYQHIGGKKDEKTGKLVEGVNWLAGLKEGHVRDNIALLYENTAMHLYREGMSTADVSGFEQVVFPMVRRIFSKLLANEIVSVQAMTQPSGAIFYFNPTISNRIEGTDTAGRPTSEHAPSIGGYPKCMMEGFNCETPTFDSCASLYDRYYDEDLYDHTKGKFTIITATGTTVALDNNRCVVATGVKKLATDGTLRQQIYAVAGFEGRKKGQGRGFSARMNGSRGYEVDTEEFLASFTVTYVGTAPLRDPDNKILFKTGDELPSHMFAMKYGKGLVDYSLNDMCDEEGRLLVVVDFTSVQTCADCESTDGFIGLASGTTIGASDIAFTWRRYDDLENETDVAEVGFSIEKQTISVEPRKLRARWTPELAMDIMAYQNIDAEAELTALMSEHIAMEIDRQILRELKKGAAHRLNWDYYGWKNTGAQKYTQKEWNETLITKVNQISAMIHKSTLRGGANFVVCSTEVAAVLGDIAQFLPSDFEAEDATFNLGMKRIGTLSSRYTVYVDPYAKASDVLVGYFGGSTGSFLDAGYVFSPYQPVVLSETLTDPTTFSNVKGLATRYATKMVNNKYYGLISCKRMITFDVSQLR